MCVNLQVVSVSRREAALAGLGALLLLPVGSAQAGLLGGPDKNEVYTADTVSIPCSIFLFMQGACTALQTKNNTHQRPLFFRACCWKRLSLVLTYPKMPATGKKFSKRSRKRLLRGLPNTAEELPFKDAHHTSNTLFPLNTHFIAVYFKGIKVKEA